MTNKQWVFTGIAGIAGAALLAAGLYFSTHVFIEGQLYPKDAAVYDLTNRDLTFSQYNSICSRLPDTQILWSVPFQGNRYASDTQAIVLTSLTKEEADCLRFLPSLKTVDASQCCDYEALQYLQQLMPECDVQYRVAIGSTAISCSDTHAAIAATDLEQLNENLVFLPRLETLTVTGIVAQPEILSEIMTANPQLTLHYSISLGGHTVSNDDTSLTITGNEVTYEMLNHWLPFLTKLESADLTDSGLTEGEMRKLVKDFPECFFLFETEFGNTRFPTDSILIDISGADITAEYVEETLPYFPKLEKLILSGCPIDDDTMEEINLRHPDVKIVWTLQIGLVTLRTDATFFYPAGISESNMPSNEEVKKLRFCHDMIAVDIGESHVSECEWLTEMPHLKFLILAYTDITDLTPLSGLKELIYLELFVMDIEDYSPLLGCTALQDLNLGTTYGDPEPISKMHWLHNLQWNHGADIPEHHDAVMALEEQLPDTNVTIDTFRNVGGPWRSLPNYYIFRELIGANFFDQVNATLYWGKDAGKILSCGQGSLRFAGDVLAEIIRQRIDNSEPIVGVKNIGSEKAEVLYNTMIESAAWYYQ